MQRLTAHRDRLDAGPGRSGRLSRTLLAYRTLADLRIAGVRYCIWKSIDRFEAGARGETDQDILIDARHWESARALLERQGWTRLVAEAWRLFPDIYDYVRYDPAAGKFIHFHIHLRLLMGESLTKSLAPPLEELYLATAVEFDGLPAVAPELEFSLFMVRVALKINWRDYARVVRRRSFSVFYRPHVDEHAHLRSRCDRQKLTRLLERPEMSWLDAASILSAFDDLHGWSALDRWRLRRRSRAHRRYGWLARRLERARRRYRQWRDGVGKTLPGAGKMFAFCGPEGSGKTALLDAVHSKLEPHVQVRRLYMGGSQHSRGPLRHLLHACAWPPYLVARRFLKIFGFRTAANALAERYQTIEAYLISREQRQRFRQGRRDAQLGRVVLYERFPIFPGYGDRGLAGGTEALNALQEPIYREISAPDLTFLLRIQTRTAVRRKPDHDPRQLEEGRLAFDSFGRRHGSDPRIVTLDGSAPLPEIVDAVMECVERELQANH